MASAGSRLLEPLGLSETEERVYRELLRDPMRALSDLAAAVGVARTQLLRHLAALESKGLISRSTRRKPRYLPASPDVAVESLIRRRQQEIESARSRIAELFREYSSPAERGDPVEFVEVVSGRESVGGRFTYLQQSATHEILIFDKPPYLLSPLNDYELQRLDEGIRYRTIYSREGFAIPEVLDAVRLCAEAGEIARVSSELPMKLAIADRRLAMIPLTLSPAVEVESAILIHPSSLLDALAALFETFWVRALPLPYSRGGKRAAAKEDGGSNHDLLALLSAGVSDEAIARQLGMSIRTVRRRIRRLADDLGVVTRFQAGVQAAKRGWL